VTDANLLLGRIDPEYFLGGRMSLDGHAAQRVIEPLAAELGLGTMELADGIVDVINAKMAQAIRTITVEKGIEPRDFSLVAFGGAGPMHAAFLAQELDIGTVIVPRYPGAFSAWGMLQTLLRQDFSLSFYRRGADAEVAEIEREFAKLEDEGRAALEREGIERGGVELQRFADMRYEGQEYTLTVPIEPGEVARNGFVERAAERFHGRHEQRYGHANPGAPVEFVALRVAALGDLGRAEREQIAGDGDGARGFSQREVVFGRLRRETPIAIRADLGAGVTLEGPVIVEEETATTVVPPGCTLAVDDYGSLVITIGQED
jgi:N-methylhydantoinase A